jgi:DNA-binding XRE family transcriptional regulator
MNVIRTKTPAGEPIVILPEAEFERLRGLAEDAEDAAVIARSRAALASGAEELLSLEEAEALGAAPTSLAFWRVKRAMSADELAERVGIAPGALADIERGERSPDVHLYQNLAAALAVSIDDLVPAQA